MLLRTAQLQACSSHKQSIPIFYCVEMLKHEDSLVNYENLRLATTKRLLRAYQKPGSSRFLGM